MSDQPANAASTPMVSVFLPVYNGAEHLAETLDSLLVQTYEDFEVVAVDDGSTDDSWQMLTAYASRDSRIRPHRLSENQGHHAASNAAIALCRGEYLVRIDQDDLATEQRLEATVKAFEQAPEVGMVYSWYTRWLPDGSRKDRQPPSSDTSLRIHQMFHNTLCHATLAFRRSVLTELGEAYRPLGGPQDYDLIVRALEVTRSYCIPEPLAVYRQSTMAMTEIYSDTMDAAVDEISDGQLGRYLPPGACNLARQAFGLDLSAGEQRGVRAMHQVLSAAAQSDPRIDPTEVDLIRHTWTRRALRTIAAGGMPRRAALVSTIIRADPRGSGSWLTHDVGGHIWRSVRSRSRGQ